LVVDDFSGYKQLMGDAQEQITEVGCWVHTKRKRHEFEVGEQSVMTKMRSRKWRKHMQ
jgi:hypothetical protein